jgi:mannose-1-phosphate guanylyltransferase
VERILLFGKKRLVAALGVKGLIIVDTEDALLACSRDHEQDVK